MKPAPFDYARPTSVAEALTLLAGDENAKVIAGGQSLVPLMAMRLARPTLLVDVNDLGLDGIDAQAVGVRIGACTRHRRLERDPTLGRAAPLLQEAAGLIGYPAIRTRGTIGGSIAHADPVAELPAVLVATGGSVVVRGASGPREIAAADLFSGYFETTIAADELLEEIRLPAVGDRHGAAFCEWAPRAGDFAVAGIALTIERDPDGRCVAAQAAACGVASVPLDCTPFVAPALGEPAATDGVLREVARAVRAGAAAGTDDDRAELLGLLAARALHRAFARSAGRYEVAA